MTYLVTSAVTKGSAAAIREASPDIWRSVRRYNLPVQLALAAAWEVTPASSDPSTLAVVSLAPCRSGSADVHRWVRLVIQGLAQANLGDTRMNPTDTLHAVDNLAMSTFAISQSNHAWCLGLGGAAGQAWSGLEAIQERLAAGHETEALLMAGDQECVDGSETGLGVALLFSACPKPYAVSGRRVTLLAIKRERKPHAKLCVPHAAAGLSRLLSRIKGHPGGPLSYEVPFEDSDGVDAVSVSLEVEHWARSAAS